MQPKDKSKLTKLQFELGEVIAKYRVTDKKAVSCLLEAVREISEAKGEM